MANENGKKTRQRKTRTFKIERSPVVKGKEADLASGKWEKVESSGSREDAEKLVSVLKRLDKEPNHYAVTEVIETGGRQLV